MGFLKYLLAASVILLLFSSIYFLDPFKDECNKDAADCKRNEEDAIRNK